MRILTVSGGKFILEADEDEMRFMGAVSLADPKEGESFELGAGIDSLASKLSEAYESLIRATEQIRKASSDASRLRKGA